MPGLASAREQAKVSEGYKLTAYVDAATTVAELVAILNRLDPTMPLLLDRFRDDGQVGEVLSVSISNNNKLVLGPRDGKELEAELANELLDWCAGVSSFDQEILSEARFYVTNNEVGLAVMLVDELQLFGEGRRMRDQLSPLLDLMEIDFD